MFKKYQFSGRLLHIFSSCYLLFMLYEYIFNGWVLWVQSVALPRLHKVALASLDVETCVQQWRNIYAAIQGMTVEQDII